MHPLSMSKCKCYKCANPRHLWVEASVGRCGSISQVARLYRVWWEEVLKQYWLEAGAIYACAVHWCRKQEDAVFLLHSTQGNTPHNCCQISAKLNNSIFPHSCVGLATFVCATIKSSWRPAEWFSLRHWVAPQPRDCFHWKQFCWLNEVWLWIRHLRNSDCFYNGLFLVKSVI